MESKRIKGTVVQLGASDKVFYFFVNCFVVFLLVIIAVPMYSTISLSLRSINFIGSTLEGMLPVSVFKNREGIFSSLEGNGRLGYNINPANYEQGKNSLSSAFIQIHADNAASLKITGILIEDIDGEAPACYHWEAGMDDIFILDGANTTAVVNGFSWRRTAGTINIDHTGIALSNNSRLIIGSNLSAATSSSVFDPAGELDFTTPKRVTISFAEANGAGNLILYINNNTASFDNSVLGNPNKSRLRFNWSINAYRALLGNRGFMSAFQNSLNIFVFGVITALFFTIPLAYSLSIRSLPGRKFFNIMIIIPYVFSVGLIPGYLVVTSLGLTNTRMSIYLPLAISTYNCLIMRRFFEGIPEELKESARIDGASELSVLVRIIMPLSKPIIMTIGLYYGVQFWNDFFHALLYITEDALRPLPIYLRNILMGVSMNENVEMIAFDAPIHAVKAASVFLSAIPMIIAYPFIQKYFTKGTLLGGVKG